MNYEGLQEHLLKQCSQAKIVCPLNECQGGIFSKSDWEIHLGRHCTAAKVSCEFCKEIMPLQDHNEHECNEKLKSIINDQAEQISAMAIEISQGQDAVRVLNQVVEQLRYDYAVLRYESEQKEVIINDQISAAEEAQNRFNDIIREKEIQIEWGKQECLKLAEKYDKLEQNYEFLQFSLKNLAQENEQFKNQVSHINRSALLSESALQLEISSISINDDEEDEEESKISDPPKNGAAITPSDLCPHGRFCKKDKKCLLKHPPWVKDACVYFLMNKCNRKNCQQKHKTWALLQQEMNDYKRKQ